MQTLSWYINRLGRMSAGEIAWRAGKALRLARSSLEVVPAPAPNLQGGSGAMFMHVPADIDAEPYCAAADRVMRGEYDIFDLEGCNLGRSPNWNRDPLTGRIAPLVAAGVLDYRDEQRVGNIKYLWEPNRHLHIVTLAQAYALTRNDRYASEIMSHIDSWITQCPVGRGANWVSALELGIRLINWSIAWQLLGGVQSPLYETPQASAFRSRWLGCVYQHAHAVISNLSRYSSANNHLIGEAAGVWIAAVTWPYWPEMREWGARCRTILAEEALKQNAPDGGNREQAISYQQFVFDFLLLSGLAARAATIDFTAPYWKRLESMSDFLASLMDVEHHVPMLGDADDGYVVRLNPDRNACPYRSLIATAARLFGRPDLARKAASPDDVKTQWLLGEGGDTGSEVSAVTQYQPVTAFPDSGYYLLGHGFETPDEVKLIVDAGPLGYLSLAAHGHADALAVCLSVGGHEILIDPGTYAYHSQAQWRRYFRSTRAHNTAEIDGMDQSQQDGSFMWSRHARSRCRLFASAGSLQMFRAEHTGYCRLRDPVLHERSIEFDAAEREFSIVDAFDCAGMHVIERHWHFSPQLAPEIIDRGVRVCAGRYVVTFTAAEPIELERHVGGSAQEGGWYSPSFGRKVPCTTITWRTRISGPVRLGTGISTYRLLD